MSRQKELDVDVKTIQQMEFVRQLETTKDDGNANGHKSIFVLTLLENKPKKQDSKFGKEAQKVFKRGPDIKKQELK